MDRPSATHGPAPRALEREGTRVLAAMRGGGAFVRLIRPLGPAAGGEAGVYASERTQRPVRFAAEFLPAFVARGWLVEAGAGRYLLGEAGRQWAASRSPAPAGPGPTNPGSGDGDARPRLNEAESPLAWLRHRRDGAGAPLISQTEFDAGERLRVDFTRAGMTPRVTADWQGFSLPRPARRQGQPGRGPTLGESALAARRRLNEALDAAGPELSGLLIDVVCLLTGLEEAERTRSWPRRSAKLVLKIALGHLARHYGMAGAARSRRSHHWGADGYRPTIDGTGGN